MVFTGLYWISLCFTGFLPNITGFYWVSPSDTVFYWVFTWSYLVLLFSFPPRFHCANDSQSSYSSSKKEFLFQWFVLSFVFQTSATSSAASSATSSAASSSAEPIYANTTEAKPKVTLESLEATMSKWSLFICFFWCRLRWKPRRWRRRGPGRRRRRPRRRRKSRTSPKTKASARSRPTRTGKSGPFTEFFFL